MVVGGVDGGLGVGGEREWEFSEGWWGTAKTGAEIFKVLVLPFVGTREGVGFRSGRLVYVAE